MNSISEMAKRLRERKLSILFVEDNPIIQQVTSKSLGMIFRNVDTASDGKEALELLESNRYDLIITDINMPDVDGSQVIRAIRQKCKIFPIIITTAHFEFKEIYKEQPNVIVIEKPYNVEELLNALDKFEDIGKVIVEDDIYEKMEESYKEARKLNVGGEILCYVS